jgi:hypothetical protein
LRPALDRRGDRHPRGQDLRLEPLHLGDRTLGVCLVEVEQQLVEAQPGGGAPK